MADATPPWCLGGLHWNWIVLARRLGTSPWPKTAGGTETRAIHVAALGGRCRPRPWGLRKPPCRRGLVLCHEHEDCRRSLALGVACAEALFSAAP